MLLSYLWVSVKLREREGDPYVKKNERKNVYEFLYQISNNYQTTAKDWLTYISWAMLNRC